MGTSIGRKLLSIAISGDSPTPVDLGAGCRFAGRCPFAFDRCRAETPLLRPVGPNKQVACHLFDAAPS
jgi:oligopeptide/dipeptide ABC transporter ATP-binding protein